MRKNKKIIIAICIIILLLILFKILGLLFCDYYKIEDRTEKVKQIKMDGYDTIGWIRVQGTTNIDLPIVYNNGTSDLTNPTYNFAWNKYKTNKLQKITTIFSHNMLNVSSKPLINNNSHKRFEQLMDFVYYDFTKKNKYIEYTFNNKNYLYKIYSVAFQNESNYEYENSFPNSKETKKYIKNAKNQSIYNFDVDVNEKDTLLTLVTCTRFFGDENYSFVIDARKVRNNERIKNYKVSKSKKYKKIYNRLKGDV